jgi:hypothetical protein
MAKKISGVKTSAPSGVASSLRLDLSGHRPDTTRQFIGDLTALKIPGEQIAKQLV